MDKEAEIAEKFWKALRSDRTMMLSADGIEEGQSQPMTALLDEDRNGGPIWIFSSKDVDLVRSLGNGKPAVAHFVAKGHDLFATVHGRLVPDNDRAAIDRMWNKFIAAWFEGGKDDPKLQLLRFDPDHAQVWLNEHSLIAGIKLLLGQDPKAEYKDKVAEMRVG